MLKAVEYVSPDGRSAFADWFSRLDSTAAAKIRTAVARIETGNMSNIKGVGSGVLEWRIDHGPGYRIYFGRDGERLVILLGGGSKRRQQNDIAAAKVRWQEYAARRGMSK